MFGDGVCDSTVKSGAGLPIQNVMRSSPSPDQPLSAEEARSWARIEAALRDDVGLSRWSPGVGLRDERAFSIGLLLVGIGAIVAGLAALPAQTVLVVGLSIVSGGVGMSVATMVLRRLLPGFQRWRALRPSNQRRRSWAIWHRGRRGETAKASVERRVES